MNEELLDTPRAFSVDEKWMTAQVFTDIKASRDHAFLPTGRGYAGGA
jgi:hypothetical protein